jgi:hypothetical protein
MIYAVGIQEGKWVKIGYSKEEDPTRRISELQTGNPFEIKAVFVTYGTLRQEQALHSALRVAFGRIRIPMPPNEWYPARNPFFAKFLEYLKYGPDAGLAYLENYNPAIKQPSSNEDKQDVAPNIRWPTK